MPFEFGQGFGGFGDLGLCFTLHKAFRLVGHIRTVAKRRLTVYYCTVKSTFQSIFLRPFKVNFKSYEAVAKKSLVCKPLLGDVTNDDINELSNRFTAISNNLPNLNQSGA